MSEPTLQLKVESWLREQGYPLEMRTAQVFKQRGWFLHHSRRYKDPNLGKEREIDLLAFNDDRAPDPKIHGHFVIECKWTPAKPWVLFAASQQTLTAVGHFTSTPMTTLAEKAVAHLKSGHISKFPLFANLEEGYALVQALSKDEAINAAYAAVQGVIAAADFFAQDMSKSGSHRIIYVPTVILEGELFRCSLAENGGTRVQPLGVGALIHKTADRHWRCVHIVRESALNTFIDHAEITFKVLRSTLQRALHRQGRQAQ